MSLSNALVGLYNCFIRKWVYNSIWRLYLINTSEKTKNVDISVNKTLNKERINSEQKTKYLLWWYIYKSPNNIRCSIIKKGNGHVRGCIFHSTFLSWLYSCTQNLESIGMILWKCQVSDGVFSWKKTCLGGFDLVWPS